MEVAVYTLLLVSSLFLSSTAQYKLDECQNNRTDVIVNQGRNITCSGMAYTHNMYWILAFVNGTERRIDCSSAYNNFACNPSVPDVEAYRYPEWSVLAVQDRDGSLDGAVVTCSQLFNQTQDHCQINVIPPYQIPECKDGRTQIRKNREVNVTCTGQQAANETWSWAVAFSNGTVTKVNCSGDECSAGALIEEDSSRLVLKDKGGDLLGANITCSRHGDFTSDLCQVVLAPPYKLRECQNHATSMPENGLGILALTCENLLPMDDMYWTLRYANGTTLRIDCLMNSNCETKAGEVYVVKGADSKSVFNIQDKNKELDGAVFTCSSADNVTSDYCQISVISYNLPQCQNNIITLSTDKPASIRCEGLWWNQAMYWTVTPANGTELRIATCSACSNQNETVCSNLACRDGNNTTPCFSCSSLHEDFNIRREERGVSTLEIASNVGAYDEAVVKCSRVDNGSSGTCTISVPDGINDDQPLASAFPTVAVAVGVVVAVVVIILIIIAVVVVKKRGSFARSKSSTEGPVWLNLGDSSDGPDSPDYYNVAVMASPLPESELREDNSEHQNYSPLELSDVGQRSEYSQLSPGADNSTTESEAKQDATYSDLDLSQVGQNNVYTELNK